MRLPVVAIIFLFVISLLVDQFILNDVRKIWKKRGFWIYSVFSVLCYALLIIAISLPRRDASTGISAVMWLLFTFFSIYAVKLFYMLCSLLGRCWAWICNTKEKSHYFQWFGVVLGLCVGAMMWIGVGYTRHKIMVTREEMVSSRLPSSFDGYKIVQLSDLHVGTWGNDTTFVHNLVDSVNSLSPDLIVFTGDLVNRQSDELKPFMETLSRLKAKDGVYSIFGNHDYGDYLDWESPAQKEDNLIRLKDFQKQMSWIMLNNESVYLHKDQDSILLIGVENWGDPPFTKYGDIVKSVANTPKGKSVLNDSTYKVLLTHNPEHWNQEVSEETNIDLTLAGHTHAMQGMLKLGDWKWSPAKYRYEQWGGRFNKQNKRGEPTELYVNIGSGSVGMPARFLSAFPEITLITLKKKMKCCL